MRSIKNLYRAQGRTLVEINMSDTTPEDLIYHQDPVTEPLNTKFMAVVEDYDSTSDVLVNLSALITSSDLISSVMSKLDETMTNPDYSDITWALLGSLITDKMVMGYSSAVPDFKDATRSIRFVQVLGDDNFDMSYCLAQTPEDRNNKLRRWQLKDMAITKVNKNCNINLRHCLLSVNGCISRPTMYNNELISPRGAEFMHNNVGGKTPSVTLLDFTNLGGIQTVPFSDCEYRLCTGRKETNGTVTGATIVPGRAIEVKFPKNISLKDKQVWVVFGHSLLFQDPLLINSDTSVIMTPHSLSVASSMLKTQVCAHKYNYDTDVVTTDVDINTYVNHTAWQADHYGAFFVIINTKEMYIRKTPTVRYTDSSMFFTAKDTNGLVWDMHTNSFFDHTCQQFLSVTELYTMPGNDICYLTERDPYGMNIAAEGIHPYFKSMLPSNDPDICVLEIIRA